MWVSMDEAIRMYARFWWARHGGKGLRPVRERARYLEGIGDIEGHRVWSRVAAEIEQIAQLKHAFDEGIASGAPRKIDCSDILTQFTGKGVVAG